MKTIKLSSIGNFKYFKSDDKDLHIMKQTLNAVLIYPGDYPDLYTQFYDDLSLFITKVGTNPAKLAVQELINRKLIYIVRHLAKTKSGLFGGCVFNGDKLVGIGLDLMELDIDPVSGKTDSIDDCFYAAYFHFIRSAILLNVSEIKSNIKLHSYLITFLYYLLLKIIRFGILPKQKDLLLIVSGYFFHRFYLGQNHKLSLENTYKITNTPLKDEVVNLVKIFESYTRIEDIFKAIIDFNISNESPSKLMMMALTTLKSSTFYGLTTSLDYFCALAIISRYPFSLTASISSMDKLQAQIEQQISPLISKVKFDVDYITHARKK